MLHKFWVLIQLLFLLKRDYFHQYNHTLRNNFGAILTGYFDEAILTGFFHGAILTGLFCGRAILWVSYFDGAILSWAILTPHHTDHPSYRYHSKHSFHPALICLGGVSCLSNPQFYAQPSLVSDISPCINNDHFLRTHFFNRRLVIRYSIRDAV